MGRPPAGGSQPFRFKPEELAKLDKAWEENNRNIPPEKVLLSFVEKFSKTRQKEGKPSVQRRQVMHWFQNRRWYARKKQEAKNNEKASNEDVPKGAKAAAPGSLTDPIQVDSIKTSNDLQKQAESASSALVTFENPQKSTEATSVGTQSGENVQKETDTNSPRSLTDEDVQKEAGATSPGLSNGEGLQKTVQATSPVSHTGQDSVKEAEASSPGSLTGEGSLKRTGANSPASLTDEGNCVKLDFEAKSSRDGAWYDVHAFLAHRMLDTGDPEVRVRFAGFGADDDEWVNVKSGVRQRSLPCEASECVSVLPGDLVLCFQEGTRHALYYDAHVIDVERRRHDIRGCRCRFMVQYEHDGSMGIVSLRKICRRPESEYRPIQSVDNNINVAVTTNSSKQQSKVSLN